MGVELTSAEADQMIVEMATRTRAIHLNISRDGVFLVGGKSAVNEIVFRRRLAERGLSNE
jgi:hypothetical protein